MFHAMFISMQCVLEKEHEIVESDGGLGMISSKQTIIVANINNPGLFRIKEYRVAMPGFIKWRCRFQQITTRSTICLSVISYELSVSISLPAREIDRKIQFCWSWRTEYISIRNRRPYDNRLRTRVCCRRWEKNNK
jgi:hypothetical protein